MELEQSELEKLIDLRLLQEYPFVRKILAEWLEPSVHVWTKNGHKNIWDEAMVNIEVADTSSLLRQGENRGLVDEKLYFPGDHQNEVIRQGEYLFRINHDDIRISRIGWPINENERQVRKRPIPGPVYAFHALAPQGKMENSLADKVKCLVWVTVRSHHKYTGDEDHPFGERLKHTVSLTIYQAPKNGFGNILEEAIVRKQSQT